MTTPAFSAGDHVVVVVGLSHYTRQTGIVSWAGVFRDRPDEPMYEVQFGYADPPRTDFSSWFREWELEPA
jgi:hypothetical protein